MSSSEPPDTTAPDERPLETRLGAAIRTHRRRLGMTASELAQRAGLSQGMLSKIENGQTSPSLATLSALAGALGVPLHAFFAALETTRDVSFVPAGSGIEIDRRGTRAGHLYTLLGHGVRGPLSFEPYLITLTEDSEPFAAFQHEGVEFIHMLEGEVVYRHGGRDFPLKPGDSLFFDAVAPHGPAALVRLPARYLSIIAAPQVDGP